MVGEIEMARKDPEKDREYDRKWKKENPEKFREYYKRNKKRILEKQREYQKTRDPKKQKEYKRNWYLQYRQKKNPNYKPKVTFHDYETHHQLAMGSGIRTHREWVECYKLGLMPDGIYIDPAASFSKSYEKRR